MAKPTKSQIEAMRKLGMSEEEIADVIKCDEEIDHNIKQDFDLSPDKLKQAQKFVKAGTKTAPAVYKLDNTDGKRSRKENATKGGIIAELADFLEKNSEIAIKNLEIVNKERIIAFSVGDDKFELTLSQKRKPKS